MADEGTQAFADAED
jgi:hypothetical protein